MFRGTHATWNHSESLPRQAAINVAVMAVSLATSTCGPRHAEPQAVAALRALPVPPDGASAEEQVRLLVGSESPHQASWIESATVIVLGTTQHGESYAALGNTGIEYTFDPEVFVVLRTIKGSMSRRDFNFIVPLGPDHPEYPPQLSSQHRYLAFLRPRETAQARLQDPSFVFGPFTELGEEDIVAIIDLDQVAARALSSALRRAPRSCSQSAAPSSESIISPTSSKT